MPFDDAVECLVKPGDAAIGALSGSQKTEGGHPKPGVAASCSSMMLAKGRTPRCRTWYWRHLYHVRGPSRPAGSRAAVTTALAPARAGYYYSSRVDAACSSGVMGEAKTGLAFGISRTVLERLYMSSERRAFWKSRRRIEASNQVPKGCCGGGRRLTWMARWSFRSGPRIAACVRSASTSGKTLDMSNSDSRPTPVTAPSASHFTLVFSRLWCISGCHCVPHCHQTQIVGRHAAYNSPSVLAPGHSCCPVAQLPQCGRTHRASALHRPCPNT